MALSVTFSTPFFSGQSSSNEVPGKFDFALAGRNYMIDSTADLVRQSIPSRRQQIDTSGEFSEQSLSGDDMARRTVTSWHHGAGQVHLDEADSDRSRFRSSKGVDVWEAWQLSLLPDTASKRSSANTNLALVPVGTHLYLTDGASLLFTTSLTGTPTWTSVTGGPATSPSAVASDGYNVWTAHGASGVYLTTRGAATTAVYNTIAATTIGYVNGRLMVGHLQHLYNVTSTTPPGALFSHSNTDFRWVGFAEGPTAIYAAGFSGDKSLVYRITLKADATALDAPIVAAALPDGEVVTAITGYLGFVLLGSNLGVRFCSVNADGSLTVGGLIETPSAVQCFEGQGKFVWFGWTNYDGTSTGLGRLDLQTFTFALTPAYASDLMATGQGSVTSVATFGGGRVFAVSGVGVFGESTTKVASGSLDSGLLTFGITDPKVALYLDVRLTDEAGSNTPYIAVDGGDFSSLGARGADSSTPFQVGQRTGERFEIRHVLQRGATDTTVGPVLGRTTLRVYPKPASGEMFQVPIRLREHVLTHQDVKHRQDVAAELLHLRSLRASQRLVSAQLLDETFTCVVEDIKLQYDPSSRTSDGGSFNGTCLLVLKSPAT